MRFSQGLDLFQPGGGVGGDDYGGVAPPWHYLLSAGLVFWPAVQAPTTRDKDGHSNALVSAGDHYQFVTDVIEPGRTYKVCVSGMSDQLTLNGVVFVRCGGASCARDSGNIKHELSRLRPSDCVA